MATSLFTVECQLLVRNKHQLQHVQGGKGEDPTQAPQRVRLLGWSAQGGRRRRNR